MRVEIFSSILEYSIEPQCWILIDVNVRKASLLSNREVLAGWVYCNGSNTICILGNENLLFMSVNVVDLVSVTS
jgi:hypothetical protein